MPVHDDLGKRMKEYYEGVPRTRLMRRTPVAIRIDGKAFHTFTRGFGKPFDEILMQSMQETMQYLCENIQGCVLGYTQSDEITLILIDYMRLNSTAWFDYEVQKLCSISASMATLAFNRIFAEKSEVYRERAEQEGTAPDNLAAVYERAVQRGAMFEARCFNIPKEEVTNLIYWRQLDAARNSIQMAGQANFSHKELQNKSCNMIQEMLWQEKHINWNDYPTECKRGASCIKKETEEDGYQGWVIDREMPLLKNEDRAYVDQFVYVGEA